jgi:hypothetical protein
MSSDTTTTTTNDCRLLALPPELRNKIWEYVMKGGKSSSHLNIHLYPKPNQPPTDDRAIHMDHTSVWSSLELAPRLNLTMTCTQIRAETELMFHTNNTFVFQTRDRRANYGILENLADWLYTLHDDERKTMGKIVVCSKLPRAMVEWGWTCAGYCGMDFGLEVGGRIDREVEGGFESWGREDGHFCEKKHYVVVPKRKRKLVMKCQGKIVDE